MTSVASKPETIKTLNQNVESLTSLDELILQLENVFKSNNVNIEDVQNLMKSYQNNLQDLKRFANFDKCHPYTKNLVHQENGKYDLILVCWSGAEGFTGSPIHDHAGSHCFMKVVQGALTEVRFAWPKDKESDQKGVMKETSKNKLTLNDVFYMSDKQGLHLMENASHNEQAASLHLYIPPITSCHTFDRSTSVKKKCQVTFWSKYGKIE